MIHWQGKKQVVQASNMVPGNLYVYQGSGRKLYPTRFFSDTEMRIFPNEVFLCLELDHSKETTDLDSWVCVNILTDSQLGWILVMKTSWFYVFDGTSDDGDSC